MIKTEYKSKMENLYFRVRNQNEEHERKKLGFGGGCVEERGDAWWTADEW